jgi:hypothetical protein
MVGDVQTTSVRAVSELDALGRPREARGSAVDLRAGFGLYALPLARRGYNVTAIDSCRILLDELESRAGPADYRGSLHVWGPDLREWSAWSRSNPERAQGLR